MALSIGDGKRTSPANTAESQAELLEKLKREAAERQRRLEEARQRAEAAREARRKAAEAQAKAREAIRRAAEARRKAAAAEAQAKERAEQPTPARPASSNDVHEKLSTTSAREAESLRTEAQRLTLAARAERKAALGAAKETLKLQLEANQLHLQAGGDADSLPFKPVARNNVRTARDPASLQASEQRALVGAQAAARPTRAAQASAAKVAEALRDGPAAAAKALREQLTDNTQGPQYRESLIQLTAPHVSELGRALRVNPQPAELGATLEELSLAASAAPETAPALAAVFGRHVRDLQGGANEPYAQALGEVVRKTGSPRFSAALISELKRSGGAAATVPSLENALRSAVEARAGSAPGESTPAERGGLLGFLDDVGDLAEDGLDALRDVRETVTEEVGDAATALRSAARKVDSGARSMVDMVKDGFGVVAYHDDIDRMGKGDQLTFALGGAAKLGFGVGVEANAQSEVRMFREEDGRYRMSVEANAGAGVLAEAGVKLGPAGAKASARATAGAGARVEMTFDSAEDAKAAMDTLTAAALPAARALGLSPRSPSFLKDHVSAVQLHGNAATQLGAFLGVKGPPVFAGAFGSAEASVRSGVRIEFKEDGSSPDIVFRHEGRAKVMAGVGLGAGIARSPGGFIEKVNLPLASGQVRGKTMVRLEERFTLPQGIDLGELMTNPRGSVLGLVERSADSIRETGSASLTARVDLENGGYLFGGKGSNGVRGQLEVNGDLQELLQSGAIADAAKGDFAAAGQKLGDELHVDASLREYERSGLDQNLGLSVMGTGFDVDIEATNLDVKNQALWSYNGTAADAARSIQSYLEGGSNEARKHELQREVRRHRTSTRGG